MARRLGASSEARLDWVGRAGGMADAAVLKTAGGQPPSGFDPRARQGLSRVHSYKANGIM